MGSRKYLVMKGVSRDLCPGMESGEKNSLFSMKLDKFVREFGCVMCFPAISAQ